jgi:hypothetical protein
MLRFKVADHNALFPSIEQMMQRRHQIVHRADRVKEPKMDSYILQPIESESVLKWVSAVIMFVFGMLPWIAQRTFTQEKLERAIKTVAMQRGQIEDASAAPTADRSKQQN